MPRPLRNTVPALIGLLILAVPAPGQCPEAFQRVREHVDMPTYRCNGLGVAADGPFVVVGNPCGEPGLDFYGYATVYRWNEARGEWTAEQRLTPSNGGANGPESSFAHSVDIDQNNIVVGAFGGLTGEFAGFVYFYERSPTGQWTEIARRQSGLASEDDLFGWGVAVDGHHAIVGAPGEDGSGTDRGSIYFFSKVGSSWAAGQQIPSPFGERNVFGWSVDLDGDTAVVGAPKQGGNRAAVYRLENGTWTLEQVLAGDDTETGDEFGHAVAVSGDTIAVGARFHDGAGGANAGAIYIFDRDPMTSVWSQTQRIEWPFGGGRLTDTIAPSRGLAMEGDEMLAVARQLPIVQRYRRQTNGTWSPTGSFDADSSVGLGGGTFIAGKAFPADGYADVTRCADVDTDGDGLLDKWETEGQGYDVNLDGVIDISLFDRGARPDRQDLFYELDRMGGVPYEEDAIVDVIEAFALAPVQNPDGSTGITLHVDLAAIDVIPFDPVWDLPPGDGFGVEFDVAKSLYWGDATERVDPNAEWILEAKRDVYRYAVIIDQFSDGSLGIAETPGNDMVCAFGSMTGDRHLQATTFMHEMGHNLNLGHGGVIQDDGGDVTRLGDPIPLPDHTNFKPNYVSVMTYGFDQFRDALGNKLPIDFSREALPTLEEGDLNETVGLPSPTYAGVWVFHGVRDPGEQPRARRIAIGANAIDWDASGMLETGVNVDLNWIGDAYPDADAPSPGQTLTGCNDWESIVLRFTDNPAYERARAIRSLAYTELTVAGLQAIRDSTPPPPLSCNRADLAPPFNLLDLADILAFVTAFGAQDDDADFDGDGLWDLADVLAFVTEFQAGCP